MNNLITFLRESYYEITQKVTWPTYTSLQKNATVVLIASLIFATVIAGVDFIFEASLNFYYGLFKDATK